MSGSIKKLIFGSQQSFFVLAVFLLTLISLSLILSRNFAWAQPQAQINVFKTSGLAPLTVLFNAKNSSGNIVRYEWNFSDQNSQYPLTDEGRLVGHRFDNPGTYNVQLTVYEENGSSAQTQITISALAQPAGAKTFYLASNGDDNNDGLSESMSWQTIAKITSEAGNIPAGSQILFKRGDTFDVGGQWDVKSLMRSHPNYITLGAYGSGSKPTINTPHLTTNDATENNGLIITDLNITGSVWIRPKYYSSSNPVGFRIPGLQVILRNIDLKEFSVWKSTGVSLENVYLDNNINGVGLGSDAQEVGGMAYFYLNNVEVLEAKSHCVYLAGGGDNILIENSKFHHCGIYESLGGDLRDGITVHGTADNLIIRNNEIYNNGYAFGLDSAYNTAPAEYIRNVMVENNKIYNQRNYVSQLRSLQNAIFRNNLIYNNPSTIFGLYGPKVDSGPIDESTNNVEIYHNTISGNTNSTIFSIGSNTAPNYNDRISNIFIKNNIISNNTGSILNDRRTSSNDLYVSNNIYYGTLAGNQFVLGSSLFTVDQWLVSGKDLNSKKADPHLVSPASYDFSLQNSSPAINTGVGVGVAYDFISAFRDNSPDIGAYENLSVPPPPADTTAPTTTANPGAGSYTASQSVALSANEAATIYYCLGSSCQPTTVYSLPITISTTQLLRYYAVDVASNSETVKEVNYVITPLCVENWSCAAWSSCTNSQQARTCTDNNNCGTTVNKPIISQGCTALCSPNWSCANWSSCSNSLQTRTCTDLNGCGITSGKPGESQSCTVSSGTTGGGAGDGSGVPTSTNTNTNTNINISTSTANTTNTITSGESATGSLIKVAASPQIYLLSSNQKRFIPSENIFLANGYSWNQITTVNESELSRYAIGPDLSYPENTLLKISDSSAVYHYSQSKRQVFFNAKYFLANNYSWDRIFTVKNTEIASYPLSANVTYPDGTLIKGGGPMVYLIESGKRRAIATESVFSGLNLAWHNIIAVSDFELTFYAEGTSIVNLDDVSPDLINSLDQDHDTLYNYLEKIYGSDINNSDTDGDGYPDGLEVKTNHDPLKPPR